jgi:hypothetical protein
MASTNTKIAELIRTGEAPDLIKPFTITRFYENAKASRREGIRRDRALRRTMTRGWITEANVPVQA